MDAITVHRSFGALAGDRFAFIIGGRFHDDLSPALIVLGREVPRDAPDRVTGGRLSFVLVEAFQNILRHGEGAPERSMLLLRDKREGCEVVAINGLADAERPALEQQLQRLHGLEMGQLKELFLRGLERTGRSQRGGAGLGLIEMARRSGHELRHRFVSAGPGRALFTLQVQVGGRHNLLSPVEELDGLHALVRNGDVLLLCAGDIGPGIQEALRPLFDKGLDGPAPLRPDLGRVFLAAVDTLQGFNIGMPLLALCRARQGQRFVLAWHTHPAGARTLAAEVEAVNALKPADRRTRYRHLLLGRGNGNGDGRLGLVELAGLATGPLRHEFLTAGGRTVALVCVPL